MSHVCHGAMRFVVWALLPAAAADTCFGAPYVGPMQDAANCGNLAHCGECQVQCSCQGRSNCLGSDSLLRCLGQNDPIRNLSKDQFQYGTCNSADTSPVGLVTADPCGYDLCCPSTPFTPSGCENAIDQRLGMPGQCQAMVSSGTYSCEASFCPTCGPLAGQCDQLCGFGLCAVCGDCWPSARLAVGRPDRCDDGNSQDGDGCSSTCEVEEGWSCTREIVPIMNTALNVQTIIEVDRCRRCTDSPAGWTDSQGYTCQDYETFGACDAASVPTDPINLGGRLRSSPEYFQYEFLYDVNITQDQPLMMIVSVQADSNAHLFLGTPREAGFEIVLGGWNNGLSVLRTYPTTQQLGNYYGTVLNSSNYSSFWIYFAFDGNLSVGLGQEFWKDQILQGSYLTKQVVVNYGWYDNATNVSAINQVYYTTGWGSSGLWDVRLVQGFAGLTLQDLATGGVDASSACCACGGGVFGRPCEQRTTGALPWVARPDVMTRYRRLAGGFSEVALLGAPTVDGFALNMVFTDCQDSAMCVLDAIVVPYAAKEKVITPLRQVWTQVMYPLCRLFNFPQVGPYYIWYASGCHFTSGTDYAVALHLTTASGSYMHLMDLQVPGLPSAPVTGLTFNDYDVRPGFMRGEVSIQGLEDETGILQYRAYFGQSNSSKVEYITDERAAKIGWINTFASGGLRSGFNNECLYGDCNWEMQLARSAQNGRAYPQYIIRHKNTNYCVCYRFQELSQIPCPTHVLTVDSAPKYKYTPTGNGALLDRIDRYFKTVWYRDIGPRETKTYDSVKAIMEEVCNDYVPCVGILILEEAFDAILFLDRRYGTSEYPGLWPPDLHPILVAAGAEQAWEAYGTSEAVAPANPSRTSLDIINDPFWQPWRAYIRETEDDCLWSLQDRIFNGTVESRLMNSEAHDCLCQVPTQSDSVGPDGILAPVQDTMWRAPHVGKFCDSMVLDFKINEKEVRTTGYCEWNLHASVPSDSVISLDLSMNDTGAATVSGSVVPDASGKAWTLTGDGHFQLPPTMLSSNYTLVAWVNIPNFIFANASDAATLQLFDAIGLTGNQEPCLQLVQRAEIDATPAFCGGEFLCNSSQHHCCYTGHGTSTTTTSTSTTWVNQTMEDEEKDCQCSCAINMTAEVEAEIGTPIGNHRWALKMRACDSEAAWDSGADLLVDPFTGESAWTMVAAVAEGGITTFYTSEPLKPEIVEYRQLFNCSSPGCQTTVIFRDIPRHPSRTCALDVDVWITDFVNDEHHSNPEVVDLIRVRGGAPVNSREIRRNCHPDGANEPNRLYKCVHKENLDEWILSTSADRALRVDVSITPWVDAYPKDGKYLTGIATVSCALVELPERNLPKSGSIHAVGSVKRSCEGSTLTAIGGAVGATADGMAPSMYLGQAWAFSRMLSKEELMALHLGTRTRYHRDYQIPVQSTEIVNPGVEVVVSGFMQCEFPGCSASVTLTGLPTNGDARCFFTYGVAITDFSGPEEVVEYIRIDEHTVVERCWPQADGNPDTFYLCADKLDVSQSVLRSSFLRDGEVVITAKLSEDVDILDFRYQNRFMLHAEATLQCLGGADKELQQTVLVQPSVTHILATPVNAQGSGPYASTAFFDTSNGFVVPPNIGQASSAALQVNVEGVTNGQFWAFVVYRHLEGVTKEEIYTGAYTSVSLCEAPQRAIGKPTLQDFNADPFLVQCEFEPGIAYTLILYLDAMAEPFGGGEIARVPFIGAMPDTPTTLPLLRARGLAFEDTNPLAAKVYGTLTITSAASEANVTHYHLYYGSFSRIWPDGSEPFAIIPATGAYEYSVLVNTQLLPGANTFLVFCKNSYGEATVSRRLGILDISMILLEDPLIALQYINGNTYLEINSQMSGPGARVDVAVVPEGGESRAQISTDYTQLDFGPLIQSTVCSERDIQYDLTSGSKVIGPCALQPAQAYTVVVYVAIRYECPCQDPCYCTGQMRFQSQAGSGLELSPTNRILLPDHAAPIFTLYPCGASCNLDSKLRLTGHVQDPGTSYPVVTMCAACVPPYNPTTDPIPQAMDPPRTCLRNGDASAHRYWRIRIPQGFACGQNTINILEAEFYEVSPLERTGLKVVPASYLAKVPEIAGADKAAAFDGSQASMYLMDTLFDAWLGIDVGIGQQAAILRFRGFWQPGCVPSKLVLEWSDDIITWTERIITEPDVTQSFTDVYVAANSGNWTLGAFYQVAFTAESEGDLIIDGVTPGSDYNIHCLSTDSAGSSGREQNALAVTTTDLVSPFLTVSNVSATDYTAKVYLDLRDPGKAYPALSTCIARELTGVSQALPPMSELSSQGQKCHYLMVEATHTGDGRVAMQTVFSSRLLDRELRLQQSQWGGHRQDYQSCGFNHEPMAGPGGCSSRGSLQKVSFLLSVKAIRDVYVWIGEIGGLGYEILLGGWQNTRVTLSHGYSRDPSNEGQAPPTVMRAYSSPDEAQILDQNSFLTFWVDADPMTGLIRVGANEIFGHNVLIAYNDSNPISPLTSLMVGTLQSEGAPPQIYVCPRVGNLLQGRSIQSSSVAFNGSPEKAVDGQWGDNTFCEYCARNDPLHVCASTRRQDSFNPPYFRIALGSDRLYLISAIRLVVPTDGRPEQSAEWTIYVGTTGFRSDSVCTVIPNARGDHIWPCTPANGNYVSVWGNVNQLKVLPEEFGIRICEIEAYATYQTTRLEHVIDKFALANGLPQPFPTDGPPQNINIYGLQPNRSYEVFCYSEDLYGNLQYSQSAPLTLKTTDTTAPKLQINHIYPTDLSITVEVGLEDPGDAYPALARCMATQDGRAPQEHDAYFEHRFWRIRFITTYTTLDPSCADRVLLRSLDLQSWLGQTFRRHMFSSDPLLPQDTIGLDTDDNGLIDSFETAAWSVPMEDAWVGIDLQYMPETAARVRSRGFLLEGDLVVGIRWEGNVDDLDLSVVGPGSEYLDFNLTEGDFYRVSDFGLYAVPCNPGDGCTTPVRSSLFVIALAGDYDIMVYRRGEKPWSQLSISAHVRLCGRDIEYQLTLADNEQNDTIASGLRVPFSKCHRKPQSAVQNLRVWQSTVHGGGASVDRMWYLADDNPHSCMETGGEGSPTPDAKPWWRVSLENTQIVQGLWLAGQSGPGVATHADVFTSSSTQKDVSAVVDVDSYNGQIFYVYNATTQYCYRVTIGQQIEEDQQSSVHACDALGFPSNTASNYFLIGSYTSTAQNEQSFENGVTCSKASGHRHGVLNTVIRSDNGALEVTVREIRPCFYEATLHVPLSTILQQGTLCAEDVPIGVLEDPFQVPATRACMQESRGSTVWVVAKYGRLRLCEVELFTEPLPTVTQVSFDYGASGNESVGAVCGANNISIEFSDDNVTWMKAWDAWADASVYQHVQFARWSWWQRLFALPFHTNFSQAESRNVTIPSLRENSSYDVLCWATDAIGNDIMQSMVVLPLPWADTRENVITTPVDYPGVRRLQENNETLRCTGWVREIMPCEEEVATSDRVIPRVVQALLVDVQTTTEGFFTGNTERVSFRMELRDGSCNFRVAGSGTECRVLCRVLEQDLSWLTYGGTCLYPRCDEQAWSNEYPVHLSFGMLQPGEDYTLVCFVTDPWGNEAQQEFTLSIPERTTPAPPSTQSTSQRPQTPAPVTQPPTQPRTTQSVEYYTRAPTVRTTAAASTSMQPPAFTTTDRTWEPRTTEEPTTTTTTTIEPLATLPPWLENYVPAGPLRTEMTLSTSSREDAEELVLPAAMNALKSALRSSLELGPLDKLTIEGTEIYLEGGSGRRLAERWLVRVRFTVEAYNAVQNKALLQRVGQLGLGESSVSSNFQEQLSVELAQRGVPLPVDFVGSIPLQDGEQWSPVPSPSPTSTSSVAASGLQNGGGLEMPDGEGGLDGVIILLTITGILACIGLLVGGAIYAICSAKPPSSPHGKLSKVANSNQALSKAESNPALFVPRTPSGRVLLPDLRETAKAEPQPDSIEEFHRKFRHSPSASSSRSTGRGGAHVVNVK